MVLDWSHSQRGIMNARKLLAYLSGWTARVVGVLLALLMIQCPAMPRQTVGIDLQHGGNWTGLVDALVGNGRIVVYGHDAELKDNPKVLLKTVSYLKGGP